MKRYRHLIENQPKIKVATQAYRTSDSNNAWFVVLAAAVASFFYFFGENLWHALSGG